MKGQEFDLHLAQSRVGEVRRLIAVLRETIDRRFRPDSVVDAALDNLDVESQLLQSSIAKLKTVKEK